MRTLAGFVGALILLLVMWWAAFSGYAPFLSRPLLRYFPYGVLLSPFALGFVVFLTERFPRAAAEREGSDRLRNQWRLLGAWLLIHALTGVGLLLTVLGDPVSTNARMVAWAVLAPGLVVSFWLAVVYAVRVQRRVKAMRKRGLSAKRVALLSLSWLVVFELALAIPLWVFWSGRQLARRPS